jgi:hypothetical protein
LRDLLPLVVDLGQDAVGETVPGFWVGDDADDVRAALFNGSARPP